MIHTRSTALEWSVKNILLEGLNRFHGAPTSQVSWLNSDDLGLILAHTVSFSTYIGQ